MSRILEQLNDWVWGIPTLTLILGLGIYLTIRTNFVQIRLFPQAIRTFFAQLKPKNTGDGVSPMQALCTALAATVGTGNLAGVAGAMAIGGPGAIFWMWICGLLGMVLKMAEATLCVRFRQKVDGQWLGGPMYLISQKLPRTWHFLGGLYAFFGIVAAFGVGNATQINAVMSGINQAIVAFGGEESRIRNLILAIILSVTIALMLSGGAGRIGRVAEFFVPFAAIAYLLLGIFVLSARFSAIPAAFSAIFRGAFSPKAVTGGMVGSLLTTLRIGISRGVFTNEAGMGTAGIAHAGAEVDHPAQQGLLGIMEVFLDTIVICTMTALVILVSGVPIPYGTDPGVALTTEAFCAVCGNWVSIFIAIALALFAFATVLGWGLYGARCAQFLFGKQVWGKFVLLQAVTVVVGALLNTKTVWILSEIVNGLMAIPNLIALAALSSEFCRLIQEYKEKPVSKPVEVTNESFYQRQSLPALSHAEIPSAGRSGSEGGQKNLSSEHRPAGFGNPAGLL